jgi:pimeloyl-ACP methyl ester carboxylesterase
MHNVMTTSGLQLINPMHKLFDRGGVLLASAFLSVGVLYGLWAPDMTRSELLQRYGSASEHVLQVDGLNIHYKDTGPKDAPVLLLLHGFGSSLQTWDVWASKLEQDYRVIRPDLPGFGLTGPSPTHDYSEQNDVAALTRFVNKLGLSSFSVVGHSMGGKMAWSLAAAEPDRVKALVLMAPDGFPDAKDIGTRPYAMPAIMGVIKFSLPKFLVRKSIETAFFDARALTDTLVDRYYDMLRAPGVRDAILDRANQTIYTDPVPRLKKITAPTLLIWGEQDQMIPSSNAQSYANVLSVSQTVLLPKLGHLIQEEQPELGLTPVTEFLNATLKRDSKASTVD